MMEVLTPEAARRGYEPDCVVTPDDAAAGRPAPWMCYRNAERLGIWPMAAFVKCGDTLADIAEGVNAGCWSVGVIEGSSEMGLTLEEALSLEGWDLNRRKESVKRRYREAGANAVIESIAELPALVRELGISGEAKTTSSA